MHDDELLESVESVLGDVVVKSGWHTGKSIGELRRCIRFLVLDEIKVERIHERIATMPLSKLESLIDRLELEKRFPNANP